MARKHSKLGKRYSEAEKHKVLRAAAKEGLTGEEVAKRFGVSALTFYRWRGPVGRGRKPAVGRHSNAPKLQAQVRLAIERQLPEIIRREVGEYLDRLLGRRRPGRPRSS